MSEFFTTNPLPCDPSSLPKFPPSKEFDAKRRDKEASRKNTEAVKGRGPVSVLRGAGPEYNGGGNMSVQGKSNTKTSGLKYEDGGSQHKMEPNGVSLQNGYAHSTSMMRGSTAGPSSLHKISDMSRKNADLRTQSSHVNHVADFSANSIKKEQGREPGMGYVPKKNRIHYSGPLVPAGGNIDDMLREHERLMQEAFRSVKKTNQKHYSYHQVKFLDVLEPENQLWQAFQCLTSQLKGSPT